MRTDRKWIEPGPALAWVMAVLALSLAIACTEATAPKYPQADDSTKKDTIKTSLVTLPPADFQV